MTADDWCAGYGGEELPHRFSGHLTCHECGAVSWKVSYHIVADQLEEAQTALAQARAEALLAAADDLDAVAMVWSSAEVWSRTDYAHQWRNAAARVRARAAAATTEEGSDRD